MSTIATTTPAAKPAFADPAQPRVVIPPDGTLPTPPSPEAIRATLEQYAKEDAAGARAAREPLPGPVRDAFAPVQHIEVGPYRVREFVDADFEWLSQFKHPLYAIAMGDSKEKYLPRGPFAWLICWIMTTPPEEVDALIREQGVAAAWTAAKQKFSKLRMEALVMLDEAIGQQMDRYWSTAIRYDTEPPAETNPAGEGEQSSPPPAAPADRSGAP